jgi:anti-sigma-K factor RskA
LQTNYSTTSEQLKIYEDPHNKMICLMAVSDTTSLAHIYWNADNKAVFVEVNNLPMAPDSMQYQLWAIADGVPQSAGMLTIDSLNTTIVQKMNDISTAQAFAITLEKKGGVPLPEGQMYVLGKI